MIEVTTYQSYHPNWGVEDREIGTRHDGLKYRIFDLEDLAVREAERWLNDEGELIDNPEWVAVRLKPEDPWTWFEVTAEMSVYYRAMQTAFTPDSDWWGYRDAEWMMELERTAR